MDGLRWPDYDAPGDLAAVEAVPLANRDLPANTYELVTRAAELWPERVALSVLPDAVQWDHPVERTFSSLLADLHR